jgi:intein/homing endonuclease
MKVKKLQDYNKKRILIFIGSARTKNNCPGQESKTSIIVKQAMKGLPEDIEIDLVDLSIQNDVPIIQPCKGCISTSGGAHCHWSCLDGEQRIQTETGFKKISDIKENNIISTGIVEKSWMTSPNEEIYEIILSDGRTLRCTKNHYIKILSNKRFRDSSSNFKYYRNEEWKKLENIKVGDFMPEPILGGEFKTEKTFEERMFLLSGLIWGDGTFTDTSAILYYDKKTEPLHGAAVMKKFSDIIVSEREHSCNLSKDYIREGFFSTCQMMKINFGSKNGRFIKEEMGFEKIKNSHERRLPELLFNCTEIELENFFNGWFSTDGSVGKKNINLYNVSYECLRDAQLLLFKIGIKCSVIDNRKCKTIVKGKEFDRASCLSITGRNNILVFKEKIGFLNPHKNTQLTELINIPIKNMKNKPSKVKSINLIEKCPVYDITVKDTHEFIAEGILVHNCDCYFKGDDEHPDFMSDFDIYKRFEKADAFILFSPINWWNVPTQVKAMFDRLVCASLTITNKQALDMLGDGNIKNPLKTKKLSQTDKYKKMVKNHLEGKIGAFYIHGDDGADDYKGIDIPETLSKYNIGKFNDPKNAIMPIVWQCRYMGIDAPGELIESFYMNENISYSEANDKLKEGKLKFAIKKAQNLIIKTYNYLD